WGRSESVEVAQSVDQSHFLLSASNRVRWWLKLISRSIFHSAHAGLGGAVGAAEDFPVRLDAVAENPAMAVLALGRQRRDGAFKAVKGVRPPGHHHFERL